MFHCAGALNMAGVDGADAAYQEFLTDEGHAKVDKKKTAAEEHLDGKYLLCSSDTRGGVRPCFPTGTPLPGTGR